MPEGMVNGYAGGVGQGWNPGTHRIMDRKGTPLGKMEDRTRRKQFRNAANPEACADWKWLRRCGRSMATRQEEGVMAGVTQRNSSTWGANLPPRRIKHRLE
jgi:hypothetical protein